jgi:hypothetical protein
MKQFHLDNMKKLEEVISNKLDLLLDEGLSEEERGKAVTELNRLYEMKEIYLRNDKDEEHRLKELELQLKEQDLENQMQKVTLDITNVKLQRRKDYICTAIHIVEGVTSLILVMNYEKFDIITTKAFGMLRRGRV